MTDLATPGGVLSVDELAALRKVRTSHEEARALSRRSAV
jgi:hypothetical protein